MRAACLFVPLLLAACGPRGTDPGPGGVTVAEAKALDDAAAMLDARKLPPDAASSTPGATASGGPAPTASPTPGATGS